MAEIHFRSIVMHLLLCSFNIILASYSFVGYNKKTILMLNVVPLSLRKTGVVFLSGCG